MDPNHWNTYNIQYAGSPGSLAPGHSSLNRLDLPSGLSLGHTLQATHSSLSGRSMSAIPAVNYSGLGVPLLDPMSSLASGITSQPSHKTISLAQSQLMFDPQVRGNPDQPTSNISRFDGGGSSSSSSSNKVFRSEPLSPRESAVTRNQILEVAAARVWGSPNFPASSLYNQFSSIMSEVPAPGNPLFSSPTTGNHMASQKSSDSSLHNPPPAHSSGIPRVSTVQRAPHHSSELPYDRGVESLIPSSLAQVGNLYSSTMEKEALSSNPQTSSLHRQTSVHNQHGYSSSRDDIKDLSANSQNPLYGSYANLTATDSHDFSATQLSTEMNYEAVSPAPPLNNDSASVHPENPSFQMVQFSEFANLASEHPHNLADKFQENDFRLKLDTRLQQQISQDALSFPHVSQERQDLSCLSKASKDLSSFAQSIQTSHRSAMMQPNSINLSMDSAQVIQTASANINHPAAGLQPVSLSSAASLQQNQAKPPVQALADSTTKPKRRSRKRKDSAITVPSSNTDNLKKSSAPQESLDSIQRQQVPQHSSNLISIPPASHISTLSHHSLINQSSQIQQQGYVVSGANQFSGRDSHRAQTPSMPPSYSSQEHQGYAPAPSPKLSLQSTQAGMRQSEFTMPSRIANEKVAPYKQGQRKSKQSLSDTSINQNNSHLYQANIPTDVPMNMQSYPGHNSLMNQGGHRDSPMQDVVHGNQHISRLSSFTSDQSQQSSIANQLSRISQQSPQGSLPVDNTSYSHNKLGSSGPFMGSTVMEGIQQTGGETANLSSTHSHSQSPLEPSPGSVDSSSMPHAFDATRNPTMVDQQDSGHFQVDFGGQPFLEQLVGVQGPVPIASANFSNSGPENGDVVFTTLGTSSDGTTLQHQQSQQQGSEDQYAAAAYEETIHEVRPVVTLAGNLNMGNDVAFNPFFETQPGMDPHSVATPSYQQAQLQSLPPETEPEPEQMSLTFVPTVGDDDDFNHFSEEPAIEIKKEQTKASGKSDSFQESFLSYLQGNKQETLSSVSSAAITKRPQLPKYIPEPRRPRPQPPPPPPPPPPAPVTKETSKTSQEEDTDALLSASDNDNASQKGEGDKDGYSVKRTSELVFKITLPKGQKKKMLSESALLSHNRKMKEGHSKVKKRRGRHRDSDGEDLFPEEAADEETAQTPVARKPSPPPVRTSIGRKAKERTRKRKPYEDSGSSTEEETFTRYSSSKLYKGDDSDQNYDSDKDPAWNPFEVDLKPGYDYDDKRKRSRRTRTRVPSIKSSRPPAAKIAPSSVPSTQTSKGKPAVSTPSNKPSTSTPQSGTEKGNDKQSSDIVYTTGQFLIEKKDLQNFEKYPIWRLEERGSMLRKYELVVQDGVVKHKAVDTYSTWTAPMHSQFQAIKVKELSFKSRGSAVLVQVLDEFKPKPPTDGKLILQYEDDPLVDLFNIYLQVFISQALQPSFLKTIIDRKETFYVDALDSIDKSVETKLAELAKQAQWTVPFKEALQKYPLMKEIDRPNLKQACQACENSSPPTIKSVVLSGRQYDKVLLMDKPSTHSDAQEFMIGKTAAYYVRTYHTLYHFKYWLRQRCDTKVKVMKDNKSENLSDEMVLDRCLENRNWVLMMFDDLKKLLEFSSDAPR